MTVKFPDSSTLETSLLKAIKANGGIARTDEIDKFVSEAEAARKQRMN